MYAPFAFIGSQSGPYTVEFIVVAGGGGGGRNGYNSGVRYAGGGGAGGYISRVTTKVRTCRIIMTKIVASATYNTSNAIICCS
jgi:hypothetical protein